MLVKCILNDLNLIKDEALKKRIDVEIYSPNGKIPLSVNKDYLVYGVEFWSNLYPRFYICDDRYPRMNYPVPYFADFFSMIDNRVSKYWAFGIRNGAEGKIYPSLSFKEWVDDPSFFERLIDGDTNAKKVFEKYKNLMDPEVATDILRE